MKRKLLLIVLIILFSFFILRHLNEGVRIIELIIKAKWEFVILALLLQVIYYFFYSILYKEGLKLFNIKWKLKEIIPLVFRSIFINLISPFGGITGAGLFLQKAKKDNLPLTTVTASVFVVILFDILIIFLFLILSLILLFIKHDIFKYEITASLTLTLLIFGLFLLLLLGLVSPKILKLTFHTFQKAIDKISYITKHRSFFPYNWSATKTKEFIAISTNLVNKPKNLLTLLAVSFQAHLTDMITLFFIFIAFGKTLSFSSLFTGYSLLILFWIVSPTPQGVGVVEAMSPVIFGSMGIDIEEATLSVLVFRGITLWLPAFIGFISLSTIVKQKD